MRSFKLYYLLFLEKRLKVNNEPIANNTVAIDATKPVFSVSPVSGNALASDWAGCFWVLSVACDWVFELLSEPLEFFWTKLPFAS